MTSITALPPALSHIHSVPPNQIHLDGLPSPELKANSARIGRPNPHGTVTATLSFFKAPEDGSKPFNYVEEPPQGKPQRNFGHEDFDTALADVRGHESEYSLDKNAVGLIQGVPENPAIDWFDDESIKTHYYPEVRELLLKHTPTAKEVYLFDHTIRRPGSNAARGPVTRCHIDQTEWSAANRVTRHAATPEQAEKQLQERYRIINVWRPLNGKVESAPLAFCDSASVAKADIVPVDHIYPTWTGETAGVAHSENQKWLYWSQMDNDERIFLQCFDSNKPMNRLPHTAFMDPRADETWKGRESIEVRALVYG